MSTTRNDPVQDGKQTLLRDYVLSSCVSLALVLLLVAVADVPGLEGVGYLFAPGLLLAAVVFPTGIHSDWPMVYIALAGIIDALLFAWPVLWLWRAIRRFRTKRWQNLIGRGSKGRPGLRISGSDEERTADFQ